MSTSQSGVYTIKLTRKIGGIPAGTTVRISTPSVSDRITSDVYPALRHAGFTDDQFEAALMSSTSWEWINFEESNEANASLRNQLSSYHTPVHSNAADDDDEEENERDSEKKKSSDNDDDDDDEESCCFKMVCSPFLLVWWIIKYVIAIVFWPFRIVFCCECGFPNPRFSFKKF